MPFSFDLLTRAVTKQERLDSSACVCLSMFRKLTQPKGWRNEMAFLRTSALIFKHLLVYLISNIWHCYLLFLEPIYICRCDFDIALILYGSASCMCVYQCDARKSFDSIP